jgi:hypothetical protein
MSEGDDSIASTGVAAADMTQTVVAHVVAVE